jgi:hypothetical protein
MVSWAGHSDRSERSKIVVLAGDLGFESPRRSVVSHVGFVQRSVCLGECKPGTPKERYERSKSFEAS